MNEEKLYSVLLQDEDCIVYIVKACNPKRAKLIAKHKCNSDYYKIISCKELMFDDDGICEVFYGQNGTYKRLI